MAKLRPPCASPLFIAVLISTATAQPPVAETQVSFRPSAGVVGAIFAIMFSLTLLLLLYAKLCRPAVAARDEIFGSDPEFNHNRKSGVDKAVIESLPFFQFSSLRGDRGGLECAVCLSRFEDSEFLRLLPKCKHAFHLDCVDHWLQSNATCPLCRHRVTADDAAGFKHLSLSSRFPSTLDDEDNNHNNGGVGVDLYVERELPEASGRSGGLGGSFRKISGLLNFGSSRKDESVMASENDQRFKHRIIMSGVVMRSRWSDVNSADIISLNCDMLNVLSSKRFEPPMVVATTPAGENGIAKIKEEMERKRVLESKASVIHKVDSDISADPTPSLMSQANRCMSEITDVSRFSNRRGQDQSRDNNGDDKVRRVWLPIARRTVQWFAGRERRLSTQTVERKDNQIASCIV